MEVKHPQMIPVPITDFIGGTVVPVNLYVRLSDSKFVLVSNAGQKPNKDQFKTYENKTVEYRWVKREEYSKLIANNLSIAGVVVTASNLNVHQKTTILSQAAGSVFTELEHMGLSFDSYTHSKQIVEATVALSESHRDLSDLFASLKDCNDQVLQHSLAVSCISVMIAQVLKWENQQTVEKLALGALLHNIGLKSLPAELVSKPKAKMTFDEIQLYETHPFKGMQMLLGLGIVPDDVIAVAYEHHENAIGQGYPRKLRNLKIHPLAKVVALASDFCELTLPGPNNTNPRTPREAITTIEVTMGQPHNREAFRALQLIVNKEFAKTG